MAGRLLVVGSSLLAVANAFQSPRLQVSSCCRPRLPRWSISSRQGVLLTQADEGGPTSRSWKKLLSYGGKVQFGEHGSTSAAPLSSSSSSSAAEGAGDVVVPAKKKGGGGALQKRILTGLVLGAICTYWVFGGKWVFMIGFMVQALLAQREYYRMCTKAGVTPARRISFAGTLAMYIIACQFPAYHEMVLPLAGTALMIWLLLMRKKPAKISEVSATIHGMFYIGYLPSFWIRLRALGDVMPSTFATFLAKYWPSWIPLRMIPDPEMWTEGAIVIWWTFFTIISSDIGAFATGKTLGKNKLSTVSSAAGATSPNKTIEGVLGGVALSTVVATIAARLLNWPLWWFVGPSYGCMLGIIGLVGDLTASMFKRDAGMKVSRLSAIAIHYEGGLLIQLIQ